MLKAERSFVLGIGGSSVGVLDLCWMWRCLRGDGDYIDTKEQSGQGELSEREGGVIKTKKNRTRKRNHQDKKNRTRGIIKTKRRSQAIEGFKSRE